MLFWSKTDSLSNSKSDLYLISTSSLLLDIDLYFSLNTGTNSFKNDFLFMCIYSPTDSN